MGIWLGPRGRVRHSAGDKGARAHRLRAIPLIGCDHRDLYKKAQRTMASHPLPTGT
jgi:hypothetical protein